MFTEFHEKTVRNELIKKYEIIVNVTYFYLDFLSLLHTNSLYILIEAVHFVY